MKIRLFACIDNNQKGHCMKYQSFGKSNQYVKVTMAVLSNYTTTGHPTIIYQKNKVTITYCTHQAVPLPMGISSFEMIAKSNENIIDYFFSIVLSEDINDSFINNHIDVSGKRVKLYSEVVYTTFKAPYYQHVEKYNWFFIFK